MKIDDYPKQLTDWDHHDLNLIWLFGMLKVRNILFLKYIPNIQSDYGNNTDSSPFSSNISVLNEK